MKKYWNTKRLNLVKKILKKHASVVSAMAEISKTLKKNVSASALSNVFAFYLGKAPSDFLSGEFIIPNRLFWTKEKIEIAKQVLSESGSVTEAIVKLKEKFQHTLTSDGLRKAIRDLYPKKQLYDFLNHNKMNESMEARYHTNDKIREIVNILNDHNLLDSAFKEIHRKVGLKERTVYNLIRSHFGSKTKISDFLNRGRSLIKSVNSCEEDDKELGKLIEFIKKNNKKGRSVSFRDVCDMFNTPPSKMERLLNKAIADGYRLSFDSDNFILNRNVPIDPVDKILTKINIPSVVKHTVRLGVIADTHFGSKSALKEELKHFVNTAYNDFGVKTILHCGDILAGNKVFRGQEAEVTHWGCDDQVQDAADSLPMKDNLKYYGILGNHDVSFIKNVGIDVGDKLAKLRRDFHYLGTIKQKIIINNIEIELAHLQSSAHARSYSLEKHVYRTYSKSNQPQVLFCGHRHTNGYFEVQRIHTFLVPCFEEASLHLQYCDLYPSIGGLIVDFVQDSDHNIIRVEPSFHLYHSKMDDVVRVTVEERRNRKR